MLEKRIESRLGRMIQRHGGLWYKFVSPGQPGVPDRIAVLPGGRIVFVELKTETGRLAMLQQWQLGRLREMGAEVFVVRGSEEANALEKELFGDEV